MNYLLWTLTIVGAWNAVNAIARVYYGEPRSRHQWSIILGIWAAVLLWQQCQ